MAGKTFRFRNLTVNSAGCPISRAFFAREVGNFSFVEDWRSFPSRIILSKCPLVSRLPVIAN
jgi:hypothetical protein